MPWLGISITLAIILSCGVFLLVRVWIRNRSQKITDQDTDLDTCWSGFEVCGRCGDSGYAETVSGGVWTGEGIITTQRICYCACGDDVRRELRARSLEGDGLSWPIGDVETPSPITRKSPVTTPLVDPLIQGDT